MFVGHYSVSFAVKAAKPKMPLWTLFLAVQAVDIGWGTLMLLGVEKARYVKGFTEAFPIDLYYMPYTHSLLAALIWSLACGALYFLWRRRDGAAAAALLGLAVLSHWFLDYPMHPGDLPLFDEAHKVGLGLWNNALAATLLEFALLGGSLFLYARACPQHAKAAWIFGAVMAIIQIGNTYGPTPPSAIAIACAALVAYFVFAYVAWRIERE